MPAVYNNSHKQKEKKERANASRISLHLKDRAVGWVHGILKLRNRELEPAHEEQSDGEAVRHNHDVVGSRLPGELGAVTKQSRRERCNSVVNVKAAFPVARNRDRDMF